MGLEVFMSKEVLLRDLKAAVQTEKDLGKRILAVVTIPKNKKPTRFVVVSQ